MASQDILSIYRGARISAFKVRDVTREIQGLPVDRALSLLQFSVKKAAALVSKTLKSAIANAQNNANLAPDDLFVKEATAGEGPTFKRFKSRARGSASPIRKRTSHIRIIVSDSTPAAHAKTEAKRAARVAGAKSRAKKPSSKSSTPAHQHKVRGKDHKADAATSKGATTTPTASTAPKAAKSVSAPEATKKSAPAKAEGTKE
jgi:large subunit ribosomal protein L22